MIELGRLRLASSNMSEILNIPLSFDFRQLPFGAEQINKRMSCHRQHACIVSKVLRCNVYIYGSHLGRRLLDHFHFVLIAQQHRQNQAGHWLPRCLVANLDKLQNIFHFISPTLVVQGYEQTRIKWAVKIVRHDQPRSTPITWMEEM